MLIIKTISVIGLAMLLTACVWAQSSVPPGTILPVALVSSIDIRYASPGQEIKAEITQDVPLPGHVIPRGTNVFGRIVSVAVAKNGAGSSLSFKFDCLRLKSEEVPVVTDVRAIASFMALHDAQVPLTGPDRGTSDNSWTTVQVGGDVVYRGGGPVTSASEI